MLLKRLLFIAIAFFYLGSSFAQESKSPWQFEVGVSAGKPTPILFNAGIGYENVFFRAMGGGLHLGPDEYWVGYRGFLAWEFFSELPFNLDLGIGVGYLFAKAPNEIYKALNRMNSVRYIRSYNFQEALDISIEARANIYGFFAQIAVPVHIFMKHDEPNVIGQVGYAYRF